MAGDTLIFPTGPTGAALTSNNDIADHDLLLAVDPGPAATSSRATAIGLAGTIDASQASGTSTVTLPITFNPGTGTVTVDNAGATLDLSGVVTATSGLTKQGAGTLNLAANDGTMAATVAAGTLLVDGTVGAVTVSSGTTLGGDGHRRLDHHHGRHRQPGRLLDDHRHPDRHRRPRRSTPSSTFDATINGTTVGTNYDQLSAGGGRQPGQRRAERLDRLIRRDARRAVHDPAQHQRLGDQRHLRRAGQREPGDGRGPTTS